MTEIEKQAEKLVKENVCKKCGSKVCGFLIHKCDIAKIVSFLGWDKE